MPPVKKHKVIITGTGRAGTTFLVQLLTALGLDTGYSPQSWQKEYHEHCQAGLEKDIEDPEAPYIVKKPSLSGTLSDVLARGNITIDFALIPIRRLEDAALSRIRVGGDGHTPGGLSGTDDPRQQTAVLAGTFHHLVETLTAHDIPHAFLHFPRFVQDANYTRAKLSPLLAGISPEEFTACFNRLARPDLIHSFAGGLPADAGRPAQVFTRHRRAREFRRGLRQVLRVAALGVMAALGWYAAGWTSGSETLAGNAPVRSPMPQSAPFNPSANAHPMSISPGTVHQVALPAGGWSERTFRSAASERTGWSDSAELFLSAAENDPSLPDKRVQDFYFSR